MTFLILWLNFVNNVNNILNQMKAICYIYTLCEKIIVVKHVNLWTLYPHQHIFSYLTHHYSANTLKMHFTLYLLRIFGGLGRFDFGLAHILVTLPYVVFPYWELDEKRGIDLHI